MLYYFKLNNGRHAKTFDNLGSKMDRSAQNVRTADLEVRTIFKKPFYENIKFQQQIQLKLNWEI